MKIEVARIKELCRERLDLKGARLGPEYYYMSLPLCVIDAVYSISIRYSMTYQIVINFCEKYKLCRLREIGSEHPPITDQLSISDCLDRLSGQSGLELAENVFRSKHRTSTQNGILKSEAVVAFLEVIRNNGIDYYQDLSAENEGMIKAPIQSIPGQKSGISLKYFLMLAGRDNYLKPDRMIQRFVVTAVGKPVTIKQAESLLKAAYEELVDEYPSLTLRELDHVIWNYQRNLRTP